MASATPTEVQDLLLSHTYESSQLITPKQLDRITIDDQHYQGHLNKTGAYSPSVLMQKPKKIGDNYFFVHKDIPVQQLYSRTALKLSDLRPWDQIAKEVHLPFPQEHPYTSHTPQFAMFPDTHPYCRSTMPLQQQDTTISADTNGHSSPQDDKVTLEKSDSIKIKVHAQTQTPPFVRTVGVARPPFPYYVTHKASEYGKRVEQRYLASSPALPLVRENREMLWDYPRSQRHKRAYTYPAPSLQYSRPPTAPGYLPPPSTGTLTSAPPSTQPVSQQTMRAINSIHSYLMRTTTYQEHFSPRSYQTQIQLRTKPDYSISSRLSQRPWTTESRGKYNHWSPSSTSYYPYLEENEQIENEQQNFGKSESGGKQDVVAMNRSEKDSASPLVEDVECKQQEKDAPTGQPEGDAKDVEMVDAETQTEEAYFEQEDHHHPASSPSQQTSAIKLPPSMQVRDSSSQTDSPPSSTSAAHRRPIDALTAKLYKLPLIYQPMVRDANTTSQVATPVLRKQDIHLSRRVGGLSSALHKQQDHGNNQVPPSMSQKLHNLSRAHKERGEDFRPAGRESSVLCTQTPRTVESTRRMMQVFHGYSKSKVLNRFNQQYQDLVPDLRRFNIKEGRRHFINGTHAYYHH